MRFVARIGEGEFRIEVAARGGGRFSVSLDGRTHEVERRGEGVLMCLTIDGQDREAVVVRQAAGPDRGGSGSPWEQAEKAYGVAVGGRTYHVRLHDPLKRTAVSARPQA